MSGLVGSITASSREINDIDLNNTIKGIKTASYLEGKIREAELDKSTAKTVEVPAEELDTEKLAERIQDDMTR